MRDSPIELLVAHQGEVVPPISTSCRDVPADLEAVILRCLEKDPARRFSDAASLEKALSECECASRWTRAEKELWWQEHPLDGVSARSSD